jgi:formamidopyrimidine-DNA glycosylase
MPELPEVEIVRRGLEAALRGRRIVGLEQRRADLRFPLPEKFAATLIGRRVLSVWRRAKYLLLHLSDGQALIMHLGMTGRFTVAGSGRRGDVVLGDTDFATKADPAHDHVVFHLSGGTTVTYNDPRRFGFMLLAEEDTLDRHPLLAGLGVEPLGETFTAERLAKRAKGRKTDLKAFLLDQRNVAGLGNIYVCEALFRAGLAPRRGAATIATREGRPTARALRLVPEIQRVLTEAIAAGGSTLRDYRKADGSSGAYQEAHQVYDREDEPCRRRACGGTIRRIVQSGRSTFYCPRCQR